MLTSRSRARLRVALAGATALLLCSIFSTASQAWGGDGHNLTARLAARSLPDGPLKELFEKNEDWFAVTSSYPDRWRSRPDLAEAPRHFLDGEHFGFGADLAKIPSDFGALTKIRTYEQLRTDGIVPWSVGRHYKLLVIAFREKRWDDAMIEASYLSHYAADSHVPFHASENYDGQLTNQKGIHSRFESAMVQRSIKIDDLKPGTPDKITDPVAQTILVCDASLKQVPGILEADKEAAGKAGGEYNDAYWTEFVAKTRPVGVARLEAGGRYLAGLLLTAWEEGGKPQPPTGFTASNRLLPYTSGGGGRGGGEGRSSALPVVSDEDKAKARASMKTIQVPSKALGHDAPVNIILPVGYEEGKKRYPVLYLMHGASGHYTDWGTNTGIAAYAQARELIIVMPDANGDSWYVNSALKGNVADYLVKDLVPTIDREYRTIAKREGRAIAGLSMGGYGAWRTALDNPDMFICTASISGALSFGMEGDAEKVLDRYIKAVYGETPDRTKYLENSLTPRFAKYINKKGEWSGPALYFDCGADDFLNPANRQVEQSLLSSGVPYEFSEFRGAHTWPYWDEHVRDVLQFVERHVSPAQ